MSKSKNESRESTAPMIDSYRSGYKTGTWEGFDWCIRKAKELSGAAKTAEGQLAMKYISTLMRTEIERRQPGSTSEGSS